MAKKKQGSTALIVFSVFLTLILLAVIGYMKLGDDALTEREAIEAGIKSARESAEITPQEEQLLRVQLAILDYMAKNSYPPNNLATLVPTYFDTVPRDPESGDPFFYRREGNNYVLRLEKEEATQLASASGVGKSAGKAGELDPAQLGGFVNPNEMKIEEFTYDPSGKRDPFLPFDLAPKVRIDGPVTPLEQYELNQLRVTAILEDPDSDARFAIVENAAGRGFTIYAGTKIGVNGGVVVSIEPDLIKVLETKVDFAGNETQNVVELKLYTAGEADKKGKKKR